MAYDPLQPLRSQLAKAEAALTQARTNMRTGAERHALPTAGIFSETEFVPRTTSERWVSEAKVSAREEMIQTFKEVREASAAVAPRSSGRSQPQNLAAQIVAAGKRARGEKR